MYKKINNANYYISDEIDKIELDKLFSIYMISMIKMVIFYNLSLSLQIL